MKTLLILSALLLASCVTTTAPDGTKTTRADVDAMTTGANLITVLVDANRGK